MAKFNITVELDWLNEDEEGYNLDEELKRSIASQITSNITKKQSEKIDKLVAKEIDKAFNNQVDKKMNKQIGDWLNGGPIKVLDQYGDLKKEHESIKQMLKTRFDNMLFEEVTENGRKPDYHSSGKMTRLDYMFNKFGQKQLDEKIKKAIEDVTIKLEKTLEESIKEHVGKSIFEHAGLSKLIKKTHKEIEMRT